MRLRANSYWLLLLTLVILSFLGGWLKDRSEGSRPQFVIQPRAQIAPVSALELSVAQSEEPTDETPPRDLAPIRGPVRLQADSSSGNLFIIDEGSGETLSEFSLTGQTLHHFIAPMAPQMQSITGLAILPDRLWIADLLGRSLHTLDRDRGRWNTIALATEPYRVEALGGKLVLMRVVAPQLFDLTNLQGDVAQSFGDLLHRQPENALALDGYIACSGNGIVYTGKYLGVLAAFSPNGQLTYLVQTIAPPPYPFVMSEGRRKWLRHGPILASLSLAASEGTVFVLMRRRVGLSLRSAVDLYRARDGAYLKTLLLPFAEKWNSIAVARGSLYAASAQRIVRWPIAGLAMQEIEPDKVSEGRSFVKFST